MMQMKRALADRGKVYADATLVFPLVVAATFGKAHWAAKKAQSEGGVKGETMTS